MSVTIVWKEGIERALAEAVNGSILQLAESAADIARSKLGTNHGGVPSSPGNYPNSQSNNLRSRINWRGDGNGIARFGTDVIYGPILEFGGTILPKRKRLAIPLSKEAKKAVAMGQRPANIILAAKANKNRPLRYIPTKGGDTLIVRDYRRSGFRRSRSGKWSYGGGYNSNKKGEAFFLLARAVKIDARPWLRRTWTENSAELMGLAHKQFAKEMKIRGFALGK